MKKIVSLILISVMIIIFSANVYATGVLDVDNSTTTITGNEYQNAQQNNTQNNESTLPQTGVENLGLGILLIACAGSAIFAYKKVSDYKGI